MASFEGLKNLATAVGLIAVPVVVAWLGSSYTMATKEREVSAKFVELAVNILAKEPNPNGADAGIRTWATRVLDQYSGVSFDTKTREDIVNRVPLPRIIETPLEGGSKPIIGMRQITRIIVRDTQEDDLQRELEGLRTGRVAYHYVVTKDGTVHRLKDENEVAFHTAGFNEDSIGIGMLHVSGSAYTKKQVDSLAKLIRDIARRRRIEKSNIVGASEVDPSRKSDFRLIKDQILALAFEQQAQ